MTNDQPQPPSNHEPWPEPRPPTPPQSPSFTPPTVPPPSQEAASGHQHRPYSTPPQERYGIEVLLVLGVSLGASAVYAVLYLLRTLATTGLKESQTSLHQPWADSSWIDLAYHLVGQTLDLIPVALALFMLWQTAPRVCQRIGFDGAKPLWDTTTAMVLAAAIGIPGLALYVTGRSLGITVEVIPTDLNEQWWQIPILVFSAISNGIVEEVIVVAYLADRLPRLGWGPVEALMGSAVLRGTYHLYQGYGAFAGNMIMGVVFWWFYRKYGRVMPLVIAHAAIDVVAFVGYAFIGDSLTWLS